jgi:hypothetical protein
MPSSSTFTYARLACYGRHPSQPPYTTILLPALLPCADVESLTTGRVRRECKHQPSTMPSRRSIHVYPMRCPHSYECHIRLSQDIQEDAQILSSERAHRRNGRRQGAHKRPQTATSTWPRSVAQVAPAVTRVRRGGERQCTGGRGVLAGLRVRTTGLANVDRRRRSTVVSASWRLLIEDAKGQRHSMLV